MTIGDLFPGKATEVPHRPLPIDTYRPIWRSIAKCSCGEMWSATGETRTNAEDTADSYLRRHLAEHSTPAGG